MIVIRMQGSIGSEGVAQVERAILELGATAEMIRTDDHTLLIVPDAPQSAIERIQAIAGVQSAKVVTAPYPLVSREWKARPTTVRVGNVAIGAGAPVVIAGPCSVESEVQIRSAAEAVRRAGAHLLRGGAYKPRTNPYTFQGLGVLGLKLLKAAGDAVGLPVVTEVMSPSAVEIASEYADMLQVGTRNMANFDLLRAVGASRRPVLLKRGMSATVDEWLQAAEYIVASGNPNVVLCERGIRSFDPATRNTLDLAAAVLAKQKSHLPVVVDPSHGTGVVSLIGPMAMAAVAAGVDGLTLEVHPNPGEAFSDGDQALTPLQLEEIVARVTRLAPHLTPLYSGSEVAGGVGGGKP